MSKINILKPDEKLIIVCPEDVSQAERTSLADALTESSTNNFFIITERYSFYIVPKGGTIELKKE